MYFVIYDLYDNIVAYLDSLDELASFTNRRKKQLKYCFKNKNKVQLQDKKVYYIYKFID